MAYDGRTAATVAGLGAGALSVEDALRFSEEQRRLEARLVDLTHEPIFMWDFDEGIIRWNRGSEDLYGYSKAEAIGVVSHDLLHTAVPGSSVAALRAELLEDGAWRGELRQRTKDGRAILVDAHFELVGEMDRRLVIESARDITETRASETRQGLLLAELSHRVKNTLAVVQSVIHQTARRSPDPADFIDRVEGRIAALSEAHNLLVESEWRGADLRRLIENQLNGHIGGDGKRLNLKGETVQLPAEIATPLGLVFHELATNAAKYGALSNNVGTVSVSWGLEGPSRRLKVIWAERNGPVVNAPSATGFGSRLIRQGLPSSTVDYQFPPGGVRCEIDVPLGGSKSQ